ncbi:2-[(L-alanin-3-ylcarbamoyl)methyl]-2-hydroxybutanedioate decarboxylase [Paenibacillus plantiphilus]|uniref:2-[(L-alanin-3-ylcarbamoyl)methyl]-2-hydroxybutanedioate decarboxylase n=1 Tax=Paenibacillus plantiphilus TaxID=2905650 RepID=A0ABM9C0B2_9BACL|nr:type III PLP-dependent enzyme [Paenibacillus plantiphilus]CAH1197617.1 2-[(L-alanin-3-ylcarbamoyl)methyl]-2-hydroxybutanedioate decarboxylase [Paenibacillus plantiphilus]
MKRIVERILQDKEQEQEQERRRPYSAYLYDLGHLREHVQARMDSLPPRCKFFYAVKANSEQPILRALASLVDGFETASLGEIIRVRGVAPDAPIIFGGPGKTDYDIEEGMEYGVSLFHVESELELLRIAHIAQRRSSTASILLRVNLTGPLPAATLTMAGPRTQFGIDERQIPALLQTVRQLPNIKLEGFHMHSISNNLNVERHLDLIRYYCDRVRSWMDEFGLELSYLNAGGGIGVNYDNLNDQFNWPSFVAGLELVCGEKLPAGMSLLFECGRYVTSSCGCYAAEVLDIKHNHGRHYAVLRGGTHHFRLPASWQHSHPFEIVPIEAWQYPFPRPELIDSEITAVGELCTPKDVLAREVRVARLRIGDIVVFQYAGAYGWAISHHDFLSHPHPLHIYLD